MKLSVRPEFAGIIRFTKSGPIMTCLDAGRKTFAAGFPEGEVYVSVGFR